MNKNVKEYLKKHPPKTLKKYQNEIVELRNSGCSYQEIIHFLKVTYNVSPHRNTIRNLLKSSNTINQISSTKKDEINDKKTTKSNSFFNKNKTKNKE